MKPLSLRLNILLSKLIILAVIAVAIGVFSYFFIRANVVDRAQTELRYNVKVGWAYYQRDIRTLGKVLSVIGADADLQAIKDTLDLDYLYLATGKNLQESASPFVRRAAQGSAHGGFRVVRAPELKQLGAALVQRAGITIQPTPKAGKSDRHLLTDALAIEYAQPLQAGNQPAVLCAGKILNRDDKSIERIHGYIFENRLIDGKPYGTVTLFLGDVRIATNVLDQTGKPAIGTRLSRSVYNKVILQGKQWLDRAFVVTDWYLTAYQPIRDCDGRVIGILYVGVLEKPFIDILNSFMTILVVVLACTAVLGLLLSFGLAHRISRHLTDTLGKMDRMSQGDLSVRLSENKKIKELNMLAKTFNDMAAKLHDREESLRKANKNYLDLIGFVSHELKGILASAILNAYSVRDGYLGMVNFKQQKALNSIAKNLDHLSATVINFLSLSRIEKDELRVTKQTFPVYADLVSPCLETFARLAEEKQMDIQTEVDPGITVHGDSDLLLIVMNNLVSNAVKYGAKGGRISVSAQEDGDMLRVEVYNDGPPIAKEDLDKLFKKFSRLPGAGSRKVKGTGLGLFLTYAIVANHNGTIWCEPKDKGNAFIFTIERS